MHCWNTPTQSSRLPKFGLRHDGGKPVTILEAIRLIPDSSTPMGRSTKDCERRGCQIYGFRFCPTATNNGAKIVSLNPTLKRQRFQKEHRWEVDKARLDWIAADIWPTGNDAASLDFGRERDGAGTPATDV